MKYCTVPKMLALTFLISYIGVLVSKGVLNLIVYPQLSDFQILNLETDARAMASVLAILPTILCCVLNPLLLYRAALDPVTYVEPKRIYRRIGILHAWILLLLLPSAVGESLLSWRLGSLLSPFGLLDFLIPNPVLAALPMLLLHGGLMLLFYRKGYKKGEARRLQLEADMAARQTEVRREERAEFEEAFFAERRDRAAEKEVK